MTPIFAQGDAELVRILHPDGAVSERVQAVRGWVHPGTLEPASGWARTKPDGTRYQVSF
jgi:hypothetical protein